MDTITITITDAAAKWGLSTARVRLLVTSNRIPGAEKIYVRGLPEWRIPANSARPVKKSPGRKPLQDKANGRRGKKLAGKQKKRR